MKLRLSWQPRTSPGIFWGFRDQMEGSVGHDDVNPVLFAGVIYDLPAGEHKRPTQRAGTQNECLRRGKKRNSTVTEKSDTSTLAFSLSEMMTESLGVVDFPLARGWGCLLGVYVGGGGNGAGGHP